MNVDDTRPSILDNVTIPPHQLAVAREVVTRTGNADLLPMILGEGE